MQVSSKANLGDVCVIWCRQVWTTGIFQHHEQALTHWHGPQAARLGWIGGAGGESNGRFSFWPTAWSMPDLKKASWKCNLIPSSDMLSGGSPTGWVLLAFFPREQSLAEAMRSFLSVWKPFGYIASISLMCCGIFFFLTRARSLQFQKLESAGCVVNITINSAWSCLFFCSQKESEKVGLLERANFSDGGCKIESS